jgi:hypothetical protein
MESSNKPGPIPTTVDQLLAAARSAAGLQDFGDLSFREAMDHYVHGLHEAELSPLGQELAFGGVVNMLVNRLRYVRDIRLHPEILQQKISKPIVILGLPRTGTTKLQRVLSACPQAQSMTYWRMLNPAPFPDEAVGNPQGRIETAESLVAMLASQFPGFMARHPTHAQQADEEVLLMQGSFQCAVTWMFARSPSFYDYAIKADPRPLYRFLHDQMQYLQWQDGGARGRSWVLKSPLHTGAIDVVLQTFPDAVLVHCHRDVCKVVSSIAALIREMRGIYSDRVDPKVIGPEMLDYFGRSIDRHLALRDTVPADRIIDVQFEEVLNDVVAVARRIFARAGLTLTDEAAAIIRKHEVDLPQHQFGTYTYSSEQYGTTDMQIAERFAAYSRRFNQASNRH